MIHLKSVIYPPIAFHPTVCIQFREPPTTGGKQEAQSSINLYSKGEGIRVYFVNLTIQGFKPDEEAILKIVCDGKEDTSNHLES